MDELQAQSAEELRRILEIVVELTELPSRWNGTVELIPDADFRGKKRFSCLIQLDANLAKQESRWLTLIHEALHCVSAGYVSVDYREYPGWEEGVVEKMQRLLRPQILARLGLALEPMVIAINEQAHRYNTYIEALEVLRRELNLGEHLFYQTLLQTPIKERPLSIFSKGNQLPGEQRFEFIKKYSLSSAVLRGFTTVHGGS